MIASKKPVDGALSIITATKAAFTNLKHVTLFFIDNSLQHLLSNMPKKYFKDVPCEGVPSNQIMGVFLEESDFCAPAFMDLEQAHQRIFNQKVISVPEFNEQEKLMFTL